jgi:lysozyme
MEVSKAGMEFIASFEAVILHTYDDGFGFPTIGIGHLIKPGDGFNSKSKITREEAFALFKKDLKQYEDTVNSAIKVPMTQNQFDAMVSLCFNIGREGFRGSSLVRVMNRGDVTEAAERILLWNRVKGRVVRGLTRRREAEKAMFLSKKRNNSEPSVISVTPTIEPAIPPAGIPDNITPNPTTVQNQLDINEPALVENPEPYNKIGFWATIKRDLAAVGIGNGVTETLQAYIGYVQNVPEWLTPLIIKLAWLVFYLSIAYLAFRVVHWLIDTWKKNQRVKLEADVQTDIYRKNIKWVEGEKE